MSQLSTRSRARRVAVVPAAVALLVLAGCGDDTSIERVGDAGDAVTTTTADETTTTTAADETTTTEPDDASDTTATTLDSGDTPAEEEATDVTWGLNVAAYRGRNGYRVGFDCPPGGTPGSLWGTGPFTDDSSVCTAAVYAGLITLTDGGRVVAEIRPGEQAYAEGSANGVTAQSYGPWSGSFVFV